MKTKILLLMQVLFPSWIIAQNLSEGLIVNDLSLHPMTEIAKPAYLDTIIDPSFGTTIRRISNAPQGEAIVPMYSTIQAWNANETFMILYNVGTGNHELLDGISYEFIRELNDIDPIDLEQVFWDFNDPDILYYPENLTTNFIRYTISSQTKETLVNLASISNCKGELEMGNDIQMMSWDSDVFTFRCSNESAHAYRISSGELITFDINEIEYTAPSVTPSGNAFHHRNQVYNEGGNTTLGLNFNSVEHSCIGKLTNGNDAYFAIAFEEGPEGGCIGDVIAHDLTTGDCFPVISQSQGYDYPQSGTHISALAHKNTESGWIAASMMGYDLDGQELLDQELVIAKVEQGNIIVCRIGHHRSDENQFDYWGEPHAVISPTGTRVLFGSDWSGTEDGQSVDSYVVELPSYVNNTSTNESEILIKRHKLVPNPVKNRLVIEFENKNNKEVQISFYDTSGKEIKRDNLHTNQYELNVVNLTSGVYYYRITDYLDIDIQGKFIKQ